MASRKFPDGSGVANVRMESACIRAIDSCLVASTAADRLCHELDYLTPGSGIIRLPMEESDSLVIAVKDAARKM